MGRQVPLEVGGEDFFLDLLFYHLKLHCYVVIELKALEDGMTGLLGLTSAATSDGIAPVGMDDLLLVLRQRNQEELKEQLGPTAWERLVAWGNHDPEAVETQTGLKTLWGISQSAVSQTLQHLTTAAAVEALPRRGRDPIQYMLTGTARLAF